MISLCKAMIISYLSRDKLRLASKASLPAVGSQISIEEQRQRLLARIQSFHSRADVVLQEVDLDNVRVEGVGRHLFDDLSDFNPVGQESLENASFEEDSVESPEDVALLLPSSIALADLNRLGLAPLAQQELELRKGQANEALEKLRLALGQKSILLKLDVSLLLSPAPRYIFKSPSSRSGKPSPAVTRGELGRVLEKLV